MSHAASPHPDRFESLLAALIDRTLDAAGRTNLTAMLRDDPAKRDAYVALMQLDALLEWEHADGHAASSARSRTIMSQRQWRPLRGLAAAAGVLLAVGVFVYMQRPVPIARLTRATASITQRDAALAVGDDLYAGYVHLPEGQAEIAFASGAIVTLIGPCDLDLRDPRAARLSQGHLSVHVPHQAAGFAIETPAARCVDLGTRFNVDVTPTGATQVRVWEGRVRVHPHDVSGTVMELTAMDAVLVREGQVRQWSLADPSAEEPQELLRDPGFEGPGDARGWAGFNDHVRRTTDHVRTGKSALLFTSGGGVVTAWQSVDVHSLAGSMAIFEAYARHDADDPLAADSAQSLSVRIRFFAESRAHAVGRNVEFTLLSPKDAADDYRWTRDVFDIPPGAQEMLISLIYRDGGKSTGRAYLDDLSIKPAQSTESLQRSNGS